MSYKKKKITATIEARMTSTRLPGKVLMEYCDKTNMEHIVERLKRSKYLDEVVVATTVNNEDDDIVSLCKRMDCKYYRGSEDDVLLRVLEAAKSVNTDLIIEITGDCPVVDWRHIDQLIEMFFEGDYDYASNCIEKTFPVGFNVQAFPVEVLEEVNKTTKSPVDHEHVSLYIYTHPEKYKLFNWSAEGIMKHPELEITLDTKEDYILINNIYEKLYPNNHDFSAEDVIKLLLSDKELIKIIKDIKRKDALKQQRDWLDENGK